MIPPLRRTIFAILLLVFIVLNQSKAQDVSELYTLYEQKNFAVLQQKTEQLAGQYPDQDEIRFFKALFLEDGDEAVKIYEQLYLRAKSGGALKNALGSKLSQFYYARGLYVRAAEFERTATATRPLPPAAVQPGNNNSGLAPVKPAGSGATEYIIQLGAFGEEENARQLQQLLKAHKFGSRIVQRLVNERNLFCVWVDGGKSLDETLSLADKIKNRCKLEYRILKN